MEILVEQRIIAPEILKVVLDLVGGLEYVLNRIPSTHDLHFFTRLTANALNQGILKPQEVLEDLKALGEPILWYVQTVMGHSMDSCHTTIETGFKDYFNRLNRLEFDAVDFASMQKLTEELVEKFRKNLEGIPEREMAKKYERSYNEIKAVFEFFQTIVDAELKSDDLEQRYLPKIYAEIRNMQYLHCILRGLLPLLENEAFCKNWTEFARDSGDGVRLSRIEKSIPQNGIGLFLKSNPHFYNMLCSALEFNNQNACDKFIEAIKNILPSFVTMELEKYFLGSAMIPEEKGGLTRL